jgi:hypothetical protein
MKAPQTRSSRGKDAIDSSHANDQEYPRTIIALFDDTIDAEHTLTALRKSDQPSEGISVILRERVLDPDPTVQYETVLSRVIASSALDAVGSWLQGLASLILPDRASYLVAGPIGAVLATIRDVRGEVGNGEDGSIRSDDSSRQLSRALTAFGFNQDESGYLEQRVVAGSPLIAVTSAHVATVRAAHKTFAAFDAVHVGLARTESSIHKTALRLLLTGPDGGGSVVIADAIAPLRRLTSDGGWRNHSIDLRGRQAATPQGESLGTIVDVLFENKLLPDGDSAPRSAADRRSVVIRYVLVSAGGFLGIGRSRVAVPAVLADTNGWIVNIDTTREELHAAPTFDNLAPLSRQDEVTICTYFDVPFYWQGNHETDD